MTTRHQLIAIAAILVLAGAIDFVQRIYAPRSTAIREEFFDNVALPDQPLSLASARERLQSWFPVQSSGNQEQLGDTKIEPQDLGAQVPDRADIGGWHFVLRGVFDAGPPFAVFDVMSVGSGEIEHHRVSAGEAIQAVRVERIVGHSVYLSDGDKMIHLALFIDPEDNMAPANEAANGQDE